MLLNLKLWAVCIICNVISSVHKKSKQQKYYETGVAPTLGIIDTAEWCWVMKINHTEFVHHAIAYYIDHLHCVKTFRLM
jgi:hypothetical protein